MKILVQNCLTHLYLKGLSEWTPKASEAMGFDTSEKALGFCMENRIPEVQVVLKFDYEHDRYDVQVPITPECEDAASSQSTLLN